MGFSFLAFAYILALVFTAFLIFFAIWHVIAFDEIKNDQKNPIEQCKTLNPVKKILVCNISLFTHSKLNVTFLKQKKLSLFYQNISCMDLYHC